MTLRKSLKTFCPLIPKQEFLMSWLICLFSCKYNCAYSCTFCEYKNVQNVNATDKNVQNVNATDKNVQNVKSFIWRVKHIWGGDSQISKGIEKQKSLSFLSPKKLQHFDTMCEPKWQIPAPANWPQAICQFLFLLALQWWSSQRLKDRKSVV